jgi:hypothetical protein
MALKKLSVSQLANQDHELASNPPMIPRWAKTPAVEARADFDDRSDILSAVNLISSRAFSAR